ncbi:MAG TPA: hypothetical protein PKE00_16435, partial [Planctomycetota bacterium]|nr:hypothetical protein [Planctomycetota bacterium]
MIRFLFERKTAPTLSLVLAACVLQGQASSQVKVIPSQYQSKEGGGNSEAPGDWTPVHMQCLYNKASINNGIGLVSGIAFRPDGTTNAFQADTRQVKIGIATKDVPEPEFSSAIYEGNRGSDYSEVFNGTLV